MDGSGSLVCLCAKGASSLLWRRRQFNVQNASNITQQ